MSYFIKANSWIARKKGLNGELDLNLTLEKINKWGSIGGTLSEQSDLQNALSNKVDVSVAPYILTDSSNIDLIYSVNTLSSSNSSITFTINYTGNIIIVVELNTTSANYTFPLSSLCVSEGVSSGTNILPLSGLSGDKFVISIEKVGNDYFIISKNFGQ